MALVAALLAGCATTTSAPVSDRAVPGRVPPPAVITKPAPVAVSRPDAAVVVKPLATADGPTHTVRPGDTLFSIAKATGIPMRDLAAWNNIDDRAGISVGQQLRLTPPDGVAVTPVTPPGAVQARPLGSPATEGVPPTADGNLKTQPLGRRVPYSEQAYAQMAKGTAPAVPAAKVEPKPEPKTETKAETKTETKTETRAVAPGEVNWSWPVDGKVIENFNGSSSKGIAIAGKRGQPVHASAAGRVILSGAGIRGLGKMVVIKHNNNYLSVYAHNDKLLVKEGQNVTRGQRIAEMGNSDTEQVKLHFEIRRQGKPVDPLKLLPET